MSLPSPHPHSHPPVPSPSVESEGPLRHPGRESKKPRETRTNRGEAREDEHDETT